MSVTSKKVILIKIVQFVPVHVYVYKTLYTKKTNVVCLRHSDSTNTVDQRVTKKKQETSGRLESSSLE